MGQAAEMFGVCMSLCVASERDLGFVLKIRRVLDQIFVFTFLERL